ncbi:MAG: cytochrome c [Spirochaetia bacterium]|nr:cytochrome c [Spirochaetia bacterium]
MKKIIAAILLVLVLGVFAGISYLSYGFPKVSAAPKLKIEPTPARLARGEYLARYGAGCLDCHSATSENKFAHPVKVEMLGSGGRVWTPADGLPGTFTAKNLTPFHLGSWSDGELFRAITSGVRQGGGVLFPLMPYPNYGQMDREDIDSIIVYLRSLKPITNVVAESKASFPMNLIMRTIPKDFANAARPPRADKLAYGKYVTTMASCGECHTRMEHGKAVAGMEFAGGMEFHVDGGIVRSVNLTPEPTTGLGAWTREMFIARFKAYADERYTSPTIAKGEFNTAMPWTEYSRLEADDLSAIYDYLKSLKPVVNNVNRFTKI